MTKIEQLFSEYRIKLAGGMQEVFTLVRRLSNELAPIEQKISSLQESLKPSPEQEKVSNPQKDEKNAKEGAEATKKA